MTTVPFADCVLSTLPGRHDGERLQVVLTTSGPNPGLVLRQQTFGEGVGWFTQKTLEVAPNQLAGLRAALGTHGGKVRPATPENWTDEPAILKLA